MRIWSVIVFPSNRSHEKVTSLARALFFQVSLVTGSLVYFASVVCSNNVLHILLEHYVRGVSS
jgi:hypothetical protein